ncbi:hypothetical protein C8A03DRAFT_32685 [Achaetomium macrosporum]|uniref:Uncharacterized protein n=1 Tax=Achaetomium macrosporum TaxID=79813 RepID=A0AAN7CC14_9PEZI|nr:hypothetical protein C8A03DRAFT_32685 [Achaetomium macrosporum]
MQEATVQSAYVGAALVHGRNQVLSYIGKPDPANHAHVVTFTTDETNLNFFAYYASPSTAEDGTLEYHQVHITSTNLRNSFQKFRKGYNQLRNLQVDAKASSDGMCDRLKAYWRKHGGAGTLAPIDGRAPLPVAEEAPGTPQSAGAEEDEIGFEAAEQHNQLTPAAS